MENKLQNKRRSLYIRRTVLALLVVLTALFQHTRSALPTIGSARMFPLVVLVAVIALFERSLAGVFFGFFAGVLWDYASVTGDGFFAVALCLVGFFCGVLSSFVLRNNIFSALLTSAASLVVCLSAYWFGFVFLKGYDPGASLLLRFYLPSAALSLVFVPIYYYLIRAVKRALDGPKRIVV